MIFQLHVCIKKFIHVQTEVDGNAVKFLMSKYILRDIGKHKNFSFCLIKVHRNTSLTSKSLIVNALNNSIVGNVCVLTRVEHILSTHIRTRRKSLPKHR